jgi:putative transcriptional regulator
LAEMTSFADWALVLAGSKRALESASKLKNVLRIGIVMRQSAPKSNSLCGEACVWRREGPSLMHRYNKRVHSYEGPNSMTQPESPNLTGKLLIAMPGMLDPRFIHSVIFMCAHSEEGAMGLIINKAVEEVGLKELLSQLEMETSPQISKVPVYFGGPVEQGRGFVLHSPDYESPVATLEIDDQFSMTATMDVLEEIGMGRGPERMLAALGYAGWGPGQLEDELAQNGWLTCDAESELVFDTPDVEKWEAALNSLGIDALALSATAGHA